MPLVAVVGYEAPATLGQGGYREWPGMTLVQNGRASDGLSIRAEK